MKYEFRKPDTATVERLIELSRLWKEEDCSYGMTENTAEDIVEPLCVAIHNGEIVGYIFGHEYAAKTKTSSIDIGCRCFSVDELYVLPEYRGRGVGKELFARMEQHVKDSCTYLTLITSTKDYRKILHFYAEELDMTFHNAFLLKALER